MRVIQISVLLILIISCKPTTNPPDSAATDVITGADELNEIRQIYYRFPDPEEMIQFIELKDLEYEPHLLHNTQEAKKYLDSRSQGLNLGIYIADLAYITVFGKHREGLEYFEVIYGLSDDLRISAAFNQSLLKRFEQNLENPDSIKVLADDAMNSIMEYLNRHNKEKTFVLMSIGGFIETMYLAFNLAGEYTDDNRIAHRLIDQKLVLQNLLDFAGKLSTDSGVEETLDMLQPLWKCYSDLTVKTEETKVTKGPDGKLIITGGETIEITEEQFRKLRAATYQVRNTIIQ